MLAKKVGLSKWESVLAAVLREIDAGAFAAGGSFHTLQGLCERYAISNTTGRRVFQELKAQGFIVAHGRAGTRVVRTSLQRETVYMGLRYEALRGGPAMLNSIHFIHEFMAGFAASEPGRLFDLAPLSSRFLFEHLQQFVGRPVLLSANVVIKEEKGGCVQIDHALVRRLHKTICPIFFHAFPGLKGVIQLGTDLYGSLYQPVRHLVELGHTRIGLVIGDTSSIWFQERLRGYLDALHQAGIGFTPSRLAIITTPEDEAECAALDRLLDPAAGLTALACATDRHALAVLEKCRQRGVRVPDDLAVTGSDDIPQARLSLPPLTSVNGRDRDKGAFAAALLARQLGGETLAPATHTFEPHLVVRLSSNPAACSTRSTNLKQESRGARCQPACTKVQVRNPS